VSRFDILERDSDASHTPVSDYRTLREVSKRALAMLLQQVPITFQRDPNELTPSASSVFAKSCWIVFLTTLSETFRRDAISLLAKPWTSSRSTSDSRLFSGALSRWSDSAGIEPSGAFRSSVTSAMIAAGFGVDPSL